jgi:hypothetical protein
MNLMALLYRLPWHIAAAAFAVGLIAVFFGVGGVDSSRLSLSGVVKLDGKPLEWGEIRFILVSHADQPVSDVAFIEQGEYAIPHSRTLVPGTYMVKISGRDGQPGSLSAGLADPARAPVPQEPVPPQFNENSVLSVTLSRLGSHRLDFDLMR